jgi:hypothetical protein
MGLLQSPALLRDIEPQLRTAVVSSTEQDAVFAGMNTKNLEVFSERYENKLSEDVIVHTKGPIQKNTEIHKLKHDRCCQDS